MAGLMIPEEIYVKYKGSEELIKIQDLDTSRYAMFLAGMSKLTGRYMELKLQKDLTEKSSSFLKDMFEKLKPSTGKEKE